jgi:hypothetical protein
MAVNKIESHNPVDVSISDQTDLLEQLIAEGQYIAPDWMQEMRRRKLSELDRASQLGKVEHCIGQLAFRELVHFDISDKHIVLGRE